LVKLKGKFPFSYLNLTERLKDKPLPLLKEICSQENNNHSQNINFNCANLIGYLFLY